MAERTETVQANRPASNQPAPAAPPARPAGNPLARRAAQGRETSSSSASSPSTAPDRGVEREEREEKGAEVGSLLNALGSQPVSDQKLASLKSQVDSLEMLVSSLEQKKGSMSRAAMSTMVDGAQTVIDMVTAGLAGKAYNPADFRKRFSNLISSWRQTSEGNCVSVATIKAAMHKWGNKVFLDQKAAADGGVDLTLRDGGRVHLSPTELETARRLSRFSGRDKQALDYANLCYAAIAKRALQQGHEGARTFARACHSLNNGEQVYYPAKLLGISDHLRRINVSDIPRHEIVVAWNAGHMIYGTNGVTDRWGAPASPWRWGLSGAYVLV